MTFSGPVGLRKRRWCPPGVTLMIGGTDDQLPSCRHPRQGPTAMLLGILLLLVVTACRTFTGPPETPSNQRYGYEGKAIVLKWDVSAGAEFYTVYHSNRVVGSDCNPASSSFSCRVLVRGTDQLEYTHHHPDPRDNTYWVAACNSSGCSEIVIDNPAQPPPHSPAGVNASVAGSSIRVVWSPVPGAAYYRIYTGPLGCRLEECIELDGNVAGTATAYTHSPPTILSSPLRGPSRVKVVDRTHDSLTVEWQAVWDLTYYDSRYYWVTACNNAGCSKLGHYSYGSASVDIELRFQVDYYQLNRRSQEGGYALVDSKPVGSPYVDRDLQPTTIYYYTVRACNDTGCSGESDETGGVTEFDGPVDVPAVPDRTRGHKFQVSFGRDDAGVSWKSVENATYYAVYQGGHFDEEVSAPGTSYRDYSPNSSWGEFSTTTYKVKACNKAGCSPFSEFVTVK